MKSCRGCLLGGILCLLSEVALAHPAGIRAQGPALTPMVSVGPGTLFPFYPPAGTQTELRMRRFALDVHAVTNAQFLAFVLAHPAWRRDQVRPLLAESQYLQHWASATALGDRQTHPRAAPDRPVVHVSWFAAKAYCAAQGRRLPTSDEWEFAAQASATAADGRADPAWRAQILGWYGTLSNRPLAAVGQLPANYWHVRDLHGLVWEWVLDFQSTLVSADDRSAGDKDRLRFCGAGALSAQDTTDYASFMRIAFRSSLRAAWTTANLGFRCAADVTGQDLHPGERR